MNHPATRTLTLGSRPSRLALWQTGHVLDLLKTAWPELTFRIVTLTTEGDRVIERPLPEIGGKGLFTSELEAALRSGEIDLAVHSLKDLPVGDPPGLVTGAVTERTDARDALVSANGSSLLGLPAGARVGTSSLRRQAQLLAARSDLQIVPLRGNVDTRVRKALQGEYDAIVLAAAGLERLDLLDSVSEMLPFALMLPAPGQGALAVQHRADDTELARLLSPLHHAATASAVTAERTFLAELGAGCSAPVAAYARVTSAAIEMDGLIASVDGGRLVRVSTSGADPSDLGKLLAQRALELGAGDLLA